jgi:hypothetical protein
MADTDTLPPPPSGAIDVPPPPPGAVDVPPPPPGAVDVPPPPPGAADVSVVKPKERSVLDIIIRGTMPKKKAPYNPRPASETLKEMVFGPTAAQEEQQRKLEGAIAQAELAGGANALVGIAGAAGHYTNTPALEDWAAKTSKTVEDFGSPPELTKSGAALLRGTGELGAYYLLSGGLGALAEVPEVARGITAARSSYLEPVKELFAPVSEALAPVGEAASAAGKKVASYIPDVPGYIKKTLGFGEEAIPAATAGTAAQTAEQLSKGRQLLNELGNSVKGAASTAAAGAPTMAVYGAVEPRSEETQEARDKARWQAIKDNFKMGGLFSGAVGAVPSLARVLKLSWEELTLSDKKLALEQLEKLYEEKTGALSTEGKAAYEQKGKEVEDATTRKSASEAALTPIEQQKAALEKAGRAAAQRELYENTDSIARQIAGSTNLTKEQAKAFVEERQRLFTQSEEAAEKESAKQFAGTEAVSDVELGKAIVPKAEKLKIDLEEHRRKVAGLDELDSIYNAKGAVFPIEPMLAAIKAEIKGPTSGVQGNPTVKYLTNLLTRIEDTAKEFGGLTRKQLDDIRLEAKDAYSNGIVDSAGGVRRAGADLKKLDPVIESITKSFDAVDKRYTTALKNYGVLSQALAPFEQRMGVFTGTTEKFYGVTPEMLPRDVAIQILDRTRGGGEGLQTLVKENPEVKDTLRQYFHGELFGASEESALKVTAEALDEFRKKNAEVLKSAGIEKDFADLASVRRANEKAIKADAKRLEEAKELQRETIAARDKEEAIRKDQLETLKETAAPHQEKLKTSIDEIAKAKQAQSEIRKDYAELDRPGTVEQKYELAKSLADRLHKEVPESMTIDKHQEILDELAKIKKDLSESGEGLEKAEKRLRRIRNIIGVVALGGYSYNEFGVGKWINKQLFGGR